MDSYKRIGQALLDSGMLEKLVVAELQFYYEACHPKEDFKVREAIRTILKDYMLVHEYKQWLEEQQ